MRRGWKQRATVRVMELALAGLVLVGLPGGRNAAADETSDTKDTVFGDGMTYIPPSDLTGWFFSPDDPAALQPSDPSQIWTSPENIATLNQWLQLATDLGGDSSVLQEMYGFGMISAPNAAAMTAGEELVAQVENAEVPEPAGFALLTGGLLVMGAAAGIRTWRRRRYA